MKRILFLIISLTLIFGAVLFSNLIIYDDTPFLPVNLPLPQSILDESYVTVGTLGSNDNPCTLWAANLPDGTEIYRFTRLPLNVFIIHNTKWQSQTLHCSLYRI